MIMQRCNPVKFNYRKTSELVVLPPLVAQGGHSTWKTWKYLGFLFHLKKHLENSILKEIHLEIPGKIFSC